MTTPSGFALYPEEQHWWSFNDYRTVLAVVRRIGAPTVLEFGPGSSTLALIEGGASSVDACEDSDEWAAVYGERLVQRFPEIVHMVRYTWSDPVSIPAIDAKRYDLALIDGPRNTENRPAVRRYALERCAWVLMPMEEYNTRAWLRPIITARAFVADRPVEFFETGADAGAFALIGPRPDPEAARC